MIDLLTKPIIGTPHIPAAKFGMLLSVVTLAPGLSEFLLATLLVAWLGYLLGRLSISSIQDGGFDRARRAH